MSAGAEMHYGAIARLYDHVGAYRSRTDVGFYVEEAEVAGGTVLEVGCGTGRVLVPTARAGITITGLDASAPMLEVARARVAAEAEAVRERVTLLQADMRDFDLGTTFPLVTMPFRPFQHLVEVEDQRACLAAVRRHLARGGRFVFDVFDPDLARLGDAESIGVETGFEPPFTLPDGRTVVRSHRIAARDCQRQVQTVELVHRIRAAEDPDRETERIVQRFVMRWFYRYELEHLLARAGLRIESVLGDFDRRPFGDPTGSEIIITARADDDHREDHR